MRVCFRHCSLPALVSTSEEIGGNPCLKCCSQLLKVGLEPHPFIVHTGWRYSLEANKNLCLLTKGRRNGVKIINTQYPNTATQFQAESERMPWRAAADQQTTSQLRICVAPSKGTPTGLELPGSDTDGPRMNDQPKLTQTFVPSHAVTWDLRKLPLSFSCNLRPKWADLPLPLPQPAMEE